MALLTYVSSKTMAEELDLKLRTIQEWCKSGKIPDAYKLGHDWRVPRDKWEAFKKRIMKAA